MANSCEQYVAEIFKLTEQMTVLADEGGAVCDEDKCLLLYGVIRDCAYKIRAQANKALESHQSVENLKA